MDCKKAPGEVRDAIIAYLEGKRGDSSISEIKAGVEEQIGPVPASSVRSYMRLNTPGLFKRTGHGRYQLARGR